MEPWRSERCRVREGERHKMALTSVHYISTYQLSKLEDEGMGCRAQADLAKASNDVLKLNRDVAFQDDLMAIKLCIAYVLKVAVGE
jgi:hypothetical protein